MRSRLPRLVAAAAVLGGFAALWLAAAAALWRTRVPAGLELPELDPSHYFTAAELERSQDYERFLRVTWVLATLATLLAAFLVARRGPALARGIGLGRVGTGIVLGMVTLVAVWFARVPFALAREWWQRRHGVSREGLLESLIGSWVTLLGTAVLACLAIAVVLALAGRTGRWWWLGAGAVFVALAFVLTLVQPLLSGVDHRPLRRGPVAADARALARAVGVRGTPVKVEDVHGDTTRANALALGVGPTKRVVLWDTLLDGRFPRGEVRVVLAHEFAHIAREHAWKGLAWFALFAFPAAFAAAAVTRRAGGPSDPGLVPLAMLALLVAALALMPAANAVSRRYEAEADWVALEATRAPASARALFRRFARTSRAQPRPPTWSYLLLRTHPSLIQRIAMAEAWEARAARPRPGAAPRGGF